MKSHFKINGVPIKRPTTFGIERYNVTNLARLADGTMVGDLIAKKRKFSLSYNAIESTHLNAILNTIWEVPSLFYSFEYVESNEVKTVTVYSGAIPSELFRTGSIWVWRNVEFALIEQ